MVSTLAGISAAVTLVMAGGIAGLFYAFSVAGMPGLDATKPEQAVAAMQSINRKILNPVFLLPFMGTPVVAALAGVLLLIDGQTAAAIWFFLAAAVYVAGNLVPTFALNVPMNNALDAAGVPSDADEARRLWSGYSPRWTRWNTLRTVFCTITLLLVGLALFVWGRQW